MWDNRGSCEVDLGQQGQLWIWGKRGSCGAIGAVVGLRFPIDPTCGPTPPAKPRPFL